MKHLGAIIVVFLGEGRSIMDAPGLADSVTQIEVNHYYDERGKKVFDQLIFWDVDKRGEMHAIAWRFIKTKLTFTRDRHRGWVIVFNEGYQLRRVRAIAVFETWTQFDPEVDDRRRHPNANRRGLTKPIKTPTPE